jgi:hypothetical protein
MTVLATACGFGEIDTSISQNNSWRECTMFYGRYWVVVAAALEIVRKPI